MSVTLLANRFIWKLAGLYERLFFTLSWVWTVFSFSLCLAKRKYIVTIFFSFIDVWDKILEPVACVRKNSEMLQLFPAYLRGEDLFGLTVSAVARIAESVSVLVTAWSRMLTVFPLETFLLSRTDPFSWGNGCGWLIGDFSSLRGAIRVITSCLFTWLKWYLWSDEVVVFCRIFFPLSFLDILLLLSKGRVVLESSRLQKHWLVSSLNVGVFGNESV